MGKYTGPDGYLANYIAAIDGVEQEEVATEVVSLPYANPIGGSGTGIVPVSIKDRFKHFAQASDFGIEIGPGHDNTTQFAEAAAKLAPYGACLYLPATNVGGYLTDTIDVRGGNSAPSVMNIIGEGSANRAWGQNGDYNTGASLKLKANATGDCVVKSPAGSGRLVMENIALYQDLTQSGPKKGLVLEDQATYGDGADLTNVGIQGFTGTGLFIGVHRCRSTAISIWVLNCGSLTEPAVNQRAGDWLFLQPAFSNGDGLAYYVGAVSGVVHYGGGIFYSKTGCEIVSDAGEIGFYGMVWDRHDEFALRIAAASNPANYRPGRVFVGNRFLSNSRSAHNTYSDVINYDPNSQFIAPVFGGNSDGLAVLPKYHIENLGSGRVSLVAPHYGATVGETFGTALCNNMSTLNISSDYASGNYMTPLGGFLRALEIKAAFPRVYFWEEGAATNEKSMFLGQGSGGFGSISIENDNHTGATGVMVWDRAANVLTELAIAGTLSTAPLRWKNGIGVVQKLLSSTNPENNTELVIQATSNTSLTLKYKGSDGVIRSGSIALT
jgi:hypothetical protein